MEQSLQGVAFPRAAAVKAELLQSHNHDPAVHPHPWKAKAIARPWMGCGVGDGKETIILQDQMMKRKRDGTVSTASLASAPGSESTVKTCEKFELGFLRHDGHYLSEEGQKKGPVCTFVKQYFQQKWRENIEKRQPVSKSKRLEHSKESQPWSRSKSRSKRLVMTTGREEMQPVSKRLQYSTAREETRAVSTNRRLEYEIDMEETQPGSQSKRLVYTTAMEETQPVRNIERLDYDLVREESQPVSKEKRFEYRTAREETQPVSKNGRLEYDLAMEEGQPVSRSKVLEYDLATEERQPLSESKRLEYDLATEERIPVSKGERLQYDLAREERQPVSKSKSSEFEDANWDKSSDYAQNEEVGVESKLLPCGTDCNQVRTEIFRKANRLMARKPEILHIKAQPKPFTVVEEEEESLAAIHQAVQTVFTQNKKVQTMSNEPRQVQWAILPRETISPKVPRLVNENQKPPTETQYNDSVFMKVSIEPVRELPANDALLVQGEVGNSRRGMKESPTDSPYLGAAKRTRGEHHLLLYQEAMDIAKDQRDLERAREHRRDFWLAYERELKRGKGLHVEEVETQKKGKRTAEEEETWSFVTETSTPLKTKLNAFLEEHLTVTSISPVSSSPRQGSGSSHEAATIFQQLLDKVESLETSPRGDGLVGLQGLRKLQAGDTLQSLEAMEKQLNPETSHPTAQLSPTELDCMKAAILSHNFYPRLVTSFINQHKASAPPDQLERLEKIRSQVLESWRPSGSPVVKPTQEEKVKKYQEILTKFERELEKPFQDAMDFSWQMEHYIDTIPPSRGRSEIGSSCSNYLKDFDDEQCSQRPFNYM